MGYNSGSSLIRGIVVRFLAALTIILAVVIGISLGLSLAETTNIINQENFQEFAPALPTKILDINGTLITEFSADEKRELVSLSELPRHLIYAVLAREDPDFYNHKGFSIRGIARAVYGQLTGRNLGGGSTITQQVAGTLYTDRTEYTLSRKIRELWWAFQMERRYTKNEILEIYLNYMYMGPGTYGVEAASTYFFGHSAREISLAEAAILVIQLSSPSRYNPLDNPNTARD
ncbi:MAG: transglycosylase domain-containing protein, partial [Treponema sp.]|nr:transglycosylase domain-containing protein [Treponema sp.]